MHRLIILTILAICLSESADAGVFVNVGKSVETDAVVTCMDCDFSEVGEQESVQQPVGSDEGLGSIECESSGFSSPACVLKPSTWRNALKFVSQSDIFNDSPTTGFQQEILEPV